MRPSCRNVAAPQRRTSVLRWFVFKGSANSSRSQLITAHRTAGRPRLARAAGMPARGTLPLPAAHSRTAPLCVQLIRQHAHERISSCQPAARCFSNPRCRRIRFAYSRTGLSTGSRRSAPAFPRPARCRTNPARFGVTVGLSIALNQTRRVEIKSGDVPQRPRAQSRSIPSSCGFTRRRTTMVEVLQ